MQKIFATILLLSAALVLKGAPPELMGEAAEGVQSALYEDARTLAHLMHLSWRNNRTPLTLVFSPAVPEFSAEVEKRAGLYLLLNGSPGRWNEDFLLRRKVYSVLLLTVAGAKVPAGENTALPPWLTAALWRKLDARKAEERLLSRNSQLPVLRRLAERGKFPSADTLRTMDGEFFTPAVMECFKELSAPLFETGKNKITGNAYLRRCGIAAAKKEDFSSADKLWMPKKKEEFQRRFEEEAYDLAWSDLALRPAKWSLKRLEELRKVKIPELDQNGNPVPEKFIEFDILEIGDRLDERPDAPQIAVSLRQRFLAFVPGESRPVKMAAAQFADLAGRAHTPPFFYTSKLRNGLEKLYHLLQHREKVDAYLNDAEFRYAPVKSHCRRRLESLEFLQKNSSLLSLEESAPADKYSR